MYSESYREQFLAETHRVLAMTKKGQRLIHNSARAKAAEERAYWEHFTTRPVRAETAVYRRATKRCTAAYKAQQDWFEAQSALVESQVVQGDRKALEKRFGVLHTAILFAKYGEWQINHPANVFTPTEDAPAYLA